MSKNGIPYWKNARIRRFNCPPGLSISSFAIRELVVADHKEIESNLALFHPVKPGYDHSNVTQMYESIRRALVEVNGAELDTNVPYLGMDEWTQRTITFVMRAYAVVNGIGEDDDDLSEASIKGFLEQAQPISFDRLGS